MHRSLIFLIVSLLTVFFSNGQSITAQVGFTEHIEFDSNQLGVNKAISIYLPPSYQQLESKNYPAMYVMDGQEYFLHPIAYQNMLYFKDKCPEFIVVAIASDRKKRRKEYDQDSQAFIQFLKAELVPYIDTNYRTLKEKERLYFGWEMAAGLGLELFAKQPDLFSAYFMASATHLTTNRIAAFEKRITNAPLRKSYLYFSKAPEEVYIEKPLLKLDSILKTHNAKNIQWKIDNLLGEDHYTTPLKTINNGLRDYFKDYNTLRFYSLKEFDAFGNFDQIKQYYQQRGQRYGISTDIHKTTKHFLLYNAMTENNFQRFKVYATTFEDFLFDATLEIWPVRFGNFYAENESDKEALQVYEAGLKKFPQSAILHNAIGTYYKVRSNKKMARKYYQLAIDYAEISNDLKIEEYKTDLRLL